MYLCACADLRTRFLWVDLQFKAILDACEQDGTPDRIPDLLTMKSTLGYRIVQGPTKELPHNTEYSELPGDIGPPLYCPVAQKSGSLSPRSIVSNKCNLECCGRPGNIVPW
jgi:hypothetical protein